MAVNWRKGFVRLWLFVTVLWCVAVVLVFAETQLGRPPWSGGEFVFKNDGQLMARPRYGTKADAFDEYLRRDLLDKRTLTDGSVLYVVKEIAEEEKISLEKKYKNIRSSRRLDDIQFALIWLVSAPALCLGIGSFLFWVVRGFKKHDGTGQNQ